MTKKNPLSTQRFTAILRSCAREMRKPYENRIEDFEDDAVVWALQEANRRLICADKTIERLKAKNK